LRELKTGISAVFSLDGKTVVTVDVNTIRFWNYDTIDRDMEHEL
jgi:hypothetical protein